MPSIFLRPACGALEQTKCFVWTCLYRLLVDVLPRLAIDGFHWTSGCTMSGYIGSDEFNWIQVFVLIGLEGFRLQASLRRFFDSNSDTNKLMKLESCFIESAEIFAERRRKTFSSVFLLFFAEN